jgi:hypothetical protein
VLPARRVVIWRIVHHAVAHPLMLVLPDAWATAFHDWTAAKAWPEEPANS